jgi:hypothetical protein
MTGKEFTDLLIGYQILKKNSSSWSQLSSEVPTAVVWSSAC